MKILFVDDNELNRMVMEDMLSLVVDDAEVTVCESAQEVLEREDLMSYDIILSDIDMPEMDGLMLYTKLREDKNLLVPIIAVTALAVNGDKEKMLMHGFTDYISKPVDMSLLENMLKKYI